MFKSDDASTFHLKLREEAETRLKAGKAPKSRGHVLDQGALALLHRLSSNPASAGDALKLLHELQVHQVELDLQIGQFEANEHELSEALTHFQTLYDFAPFAYFLVDSEGNISKANLMAAELTGVDRDELTGRRIDSFLQAESQPKLLALLGQPDSNAQAVEVVMADVENGARPLLIMAKPSHDAGCILLACCEPPQTGRD